MKSDTTTTVLNFILAVLVKILPPWVESQAPSGD